MSRAVAVNDRPDQSTEQLAVPADQSAGDMREQMRTLLAWEDIQDEADELKLDDTQKRQLAKKHQAQPP